MANKLVRVCDEDSCSVSAAHTCALCSADLCEFHSTVLSLTLKQGSLRQRTERLCFDCAKLAVIGYRSEGNSTILPMPLTIGMPETVASNA